MKKVFLAFVMSLFGATFASAAGYFISGTFTDFDFEAMTAQDGKYTYTAPTNGGFNIYDSDDFINAAMYGVKIEDRDAKFELNKPLTLVENGSQINFGSSITALNEVLITFDPTTMTVVATDPAAASLPKYYIAGSFQGTDFSQAVEMSYDNGKYTYSLPAEGGKGFIILNEPSWSAKSFGPSTTTFAVYNQTVNLVEGSTFMVYFDWYIAPCADALVTFDPANLTVVVTNPNAEVPKPTTFYIAGGFNDWDVANAPQMSTYGDWKSYRINSLPNTGFKILGQRNLDVKQWVLGAAAENSLEVNVAQPVVAGDEGKNFTFAKDVVSIANARVLFEPTDMTVTVTGYPVYENEPVPDNLFVYGNVNGLDFDTKNAIKGVKRGNTFIFSGIELNCTYRQTSLFAFTPIRSADREGEVAGLQYGPKQEVEDVTLDTPTGFGRNGYTHYRLPNGTYKMVVDFDNHTVVCTKSNSVDPDQVFYIWGTFNDSNIEEAQELTFENGVYTYKLAEMTAETGFMISSENSTASYKNYGVDNKEKAEIDKPLTVTSGTPTAGRFIYLNLPAGTDKFENALITFDTSDFTVTVSEAVPEAEYYVVGLFNNWDIENAVQMTRNTENVYTLTMDKLVNQFKIVGQRAWDNSKTFGAQTPYSLKSGVPAPVVVGGYDFGFADEVTAFENATISFAPDNKTLTVTGNPVTEQPVLYLRGSMNDWAATDATKMTYDEATHSYTIGEVEVQETTEFKLASADYAINYGGVDFSGEMMRGVLTATTDNCKMTVPAAGKYDFSFNYAAKLLTITKSKVGIETIDAEALNAQSEVYTLQGRRVYGAPTPGIYVVIRNGNATKIAVR